MYYLLLGFLGSQLPWYVRHADDMALVFGILSIVFAYYVIRGVCRSIRRYWRLLKYVVPLLTGVGLALALGI